MMQDERVAKIRGGHWIRYTRAEQIDTRLDELLAIPKTHRMPNLLIVGETNNGKTALVTRSSCGTTRPSSAIAARRRAFLSSPFRRLRFPTSAGSIRPSSPGCRAVSPLTISRSSAT